MTRAFIFPGQGSQAVGMGHELAAAFAPARHVFEEVDDALSQKLSRLIFEGPEDELTLTENAQPALMAMSLAVLRTLEQEGSVEVGRDVAFVAGHSLGEYTALTAARALTLDDTARLLRVRGRAMQEAVPVGEGAMTALLGVELEAAREIAAEAAATAEGGDAVCEVANDNAPGQAVLSGSSAAIDRAREIAKEKGAKRAIALPVSAPFHCRLMAPAAEAMTDELAKVELRPPVVPLVANVSAEGVSDPETIRALLVEQVTAMVRWRESVQYMNQQGVDTLIELGAGKVLTGLARRIEPEMTALAVATPADVEALLKTF